MAPFKLCIEIFEYYSKALGLIILFYASPYQACCMTFYFALLHCLVSSKQFVFIEFLNVLLPITLKLPTNKTTWDWLYVSLLLQDIDK